MTTHNQQLDEIYCALGPKGRFFQFQLLIIWIAYIPAALQLLSNVFIGPTLPHRCASPTNESEFINSYREIDGYSNVTVFYDECEIRIKSNDTTIKKETCVFGMAYDSPIDSSFTSQFDLVCDSTNLARLTQTLVIAGQACGALIAAGLSDRFGRKPILVGAHFGITLTGIAIAYSTNYVMFSISKFIVGGFQQAIVTVMTNIAVELMRRKDRRIAATLMGMYWASGVILLDAISYILRYHSWRTVQLVLTLVTIPSFLEICLMKESLRWLLANGKIDKATAYIKNAARMNGKKQEDITHILQLLTTWDKSTKDAPKKVDNQKADKVDDSEEKSSKTMSYLDLFRHRRLFLNTLVLWVAWFTVAFGFFAIYLGSTDLSGNRFLNFFLTALMEIPSKFYFYYGLNRHGRKAVLVVMFSTMSVGLIGSGITSSLGDTTLYSALSIAFNMVAMIGASGGFGIVFFYTPELFPTNIRNQALGISSTISRIGGMLAPFTAVLYTHWGQLSPPLFDRISDMENRYSNAFYFKIGYITKSDQAKWGPGVLIGGLACLVALLVRFLPETNGKELPQTMEDLQAWFKNDTKNSSNGAVEVKKNNEKIGEDNQVFTVM